MNINPKISAVIIACNEQKHIAKCIQSILSITSDIVLVDSGSTDRTVDIAEKLGARVYHLPWKGYGVNKNYGIDKAKNDWILSIDADEILDKDLIDQINTINKNVNTIYRIKSLVNYSGKWIHHCGWYPAWKLRFFNRATAKWNLDPVHESLVYQPKTKFHNLEGHLLHYSYDSIEDHKIKSTKYGKLKAESWIKNEKSMGILKRYCGPYFKFIRTYILKLGFLDGKEGFIISKIDAKMISTAISHYKLLKKKGQ